MRVVSKIGVRLGRVLSLVLLAALGSVVLMRYSPGYFSDAREMDALHADGARAQVAELQVAQASLPALLASELRRWLHGDLGISRHYNVPVTGLLEHRAGTSARLMFGGIALGWAIALALALPLSALRGNRGELLVTSSTAALLAVPVGVLATVCLLTNVGGPVSVLASLVAVRDFKLVYRLLRDAWEAPHLLYARAQGMCFRQTVFIHLLPVLTREVFALALMSVVVALSSLVPIEVIFDLPGLGQLAWSAAMNRDLPVLTAVTAVLAACVGIAGLFGSPEQQTEVAQCA